MKINQKIRKVKESYSDLFYFNPLPNCFFDLDTFEILDVNNAAVALYGYNKEEFFQLTIMDLMPPESFSKMLLTISQEEANTAAIYLGVFTHKKKSGENIRIEMNGHPIDFQQKKGMLVVCQDVTERELKYRNLKESEKRLKAASAIAKLGYWKLELDANTLSWSDEVYKIWGRTKEDFDVNFDNFFQTIHPDDKETFEIEQNASFLGEKEHDFIHRIVLPNGNIRWVHEMGRLVKDKNGNPKVFEGTVRDITVEKEEVQRLRLLESVITNTSDAVLITEAEPFDSPGPRIVFVNEAFTKMTGYASDEVVGKTPRVLQGPKSNKAELAKLKKALQNWESCEITMINYKKNGEEFWINFSVTPIANEKGWFTHWIAIERDVTAKMNRELEERLLRQISLIFNEETELKNATDKLCSEFADFGQFDFVEVWIPNLENSLIQLLSYHNNSDTAAQFYLQTQEIRSFKFGEGLAGLVWETKKPIVWDIEDKKDFIVRKDAALQAGIQAVSGIPLLFKDSIVGVLVFGSTKKSVQLSRYVGVFKELETFIGSEINRKMLESSLNHLFKAIPDIVCLADFQGRFLKMNAAGCELLGYSEEELLFHHCVEFVHPEDKDISLQELQKIGEDKTTFKFENRYITKKGEIVWLSWVCTSQLEDGLIYATAKNITKEKKLSELNAQASSLAKIGSWEIDLIDRKLFWTDMVHQLHETNPRNFVPDLLKGINFYRKDFREMIRQSINSCISEGKTFNFEAALITAKKNERWVRVIGNADLVDGKCVRIYGSFQDIHDAKMLELQFSEILGSISDAFYALDKDWKINYFNKEAENLLKKRAVDIIGKNLWQEFPAAIGTSLERVYYNVAKSKQSTSFEYFFPGDCKWYEINVYPSNGGISVYFKNIDERKLAGEQLEKAYLEKNNIVESIADAFFTIDKNFIVSYWNRAAEELLDVKREQLLGKNLWDVFPDAVSLPSYANYHKVLKTGQPISFEDYYGIWLEVNAYPSEEGLTVFFRDISLRKKLLDVYEERNNILESIGDAFFAVDNEWIVTYWNKEAENLLGKGRDRVMGKNLWEEYADAIDSDFYHQYHFAMETQKNVSFEEYYTTLNKWFEVSVYPSSDGLSVYFKDVTLRKQSDLRLLRANERFEKVTEATNDAIWDLKIEEGILYWGIGFKKLFGHDLDKITPTMQFWTENVHPDDFKAVHESLLRVEQDSKLLNWKSEYRFRRADGTYAYVIDRAIVIRNNKGEAIRIIGAVTDVSERKLQEVKLQEANESLKKYAHDLELSNEQLEQFAFIASHDLQEPLRMITSFMNQLERKYGDVLDQKAHEYIYFATDGAKRMKQIILDLLEYSRAGKLDENKEKVSLADLVEDYKILRSKIITEKSVLIHFNHLPIIEAFRVPLVQTLHCLLDNAIKYSSKTVSPVVELKVEDKTEEWLFVVKDNGIGIASQFFEKIFIIFQRLHNRNEYSGTGIGLAIAKKHIESWGGKIWLESEENKGTTFYFTIPKNNPKV